MPNDPKDAHVLAAAVAGNVGRVVTNNLQHFKASDVAKVGKESLSADQFLSEQLQRTPLLVRASLRRQVEHMHRPRRWTEGEFLGRLAGLGRGDPLAPGFVKAYEQRFRCAAVPPPEEECRHRAGAAPRNEA